jgi:hypothetical protein
MRAEPKRQKQTEADYFWIEISSFFFNQKIKFGLALEYLANLSRN